MFPIKFTGRATGLAAIVVSIIVLSLNAAVYAAGAFVVAWAAHKGWSAS